LLTPPSYHSAIDIVTILSMYYGIQFFGKINGSQLIFKKMTHIASLLTVVIIIINISLNLLFINEWGAIGAAWATFITGLLSGIVVYIIAQHYYKIIWEYRKIGGIFLSFLCASLMTILLRYFGVNYLIQMTFKLTWLVIFVFIGYKIEVISVENLLMAKSLAQKVFVGLRAHTLKK